jgi:hypothetical protein
LIVTSRSSSAAITSTSSSVSDCVAVFIVEVHQELDDLRHRNAERLREVARRRLDGCRPVGAQPARLARATVGRTIARPLTLAGLGARRRRR